MAKDDLDVLCKRMTKGRPFGDDQWAERTAGRAGLESALRDRGRPAKIKPMAMGVNESSQRPDCKNE